MEIEFSIIEYQSELWYEAVMLRERILRIPMGKKFTKEELAAEKHHIQIIGLKGTRVIATAVLVPEEKSLKMQRVVVDNECRNLEIGSNMMVYCEHYALNNGFNLIYCHARDSAVNFYLKNDYLAKGDAFDEDGIPHLKMKKQL